MVTGLADRERAAGRVAGPGGLVRNARSINPQNAKRACLEAEMLTDVQQRLALLSRDMDNHNGHRIPHQPTFTGR